MFRKGEDNKTKWAFSSHVPTETFAPRSLVDLFNIVISVPRDREMAANPVRVGHLLRDGLASRGLGLLGRRRGQVAEIASRLTRHPEGPYFLPFQLKKLDH